MALPTSMKTWRYITTASGGLEKNLQMVLAADLPPHDNLSPTQALVRVHATSVNPVDYKMVEIPLVGSYMAKMPATPGKDFAGTVAKLGPKSSTGLSEGQRVFGRLAGQPKYGAFGEYALVNVGEDACVTLPEGVTFEAGAAFGTAGTAAMQSIKPFLPAEGGGAVFINGGAAGTSTFALQLSRALGAKEIVTTCSTQSIQLVKSLGATECIDYNTTNVIDALKKKGLFFDIMVDFIGNPTNLYKQSRHFLKPSGQFVQIAAMPTAAGIRSLLSAQYQPRFLGSRTRKYAFLRSQNVGEDFKLTGKWLQEKMVEAIIDTEYK